MRVHLIPHLEQELYLGIDFWRLFGTTPNIIAALEVNPELSLENNDILNKHDLSDEQSLKLAEVVKQFSSFLSHYQCRSRASS